MSQRGVSAPVELVKTVVPLCLSRLCLSAWRGLILARACSRWFIKMGPGKTRGPGGERNFHMHAQCSQMEKNTWKYYTTTIHTQLKNIKKTPARGNSPRHNTQAHSTRKLSDTKQDGYPVSFTLCTNPNSLLLAVPMVNGLPQKS